MRTNIRSGLIKVMGCAVAASLVCASAVVAVAQTDGPEGSPLEIQAFLVSDVNEDRVIQRDEFRTLIDTLADQGRRSAQRVRSMRLYGFAFNFTDTNKDGVLTPDELRSANADDKRKRGE